MNGGDRKLAERGEWFVKLIEMIIESSSTNLVLHSLVFRLKDIKLISLGAVFC